MLFRKCWWWCCFSCRRWFRKFDIDHDDGDTVFHCRWRTTRNNATVADGRQRPAAGWRRRWRAEASGGGVATAADQAGGARDGRAVWAADQTESPGDENGRRRQIGTNSAVYFWSQDLWFFLDYANVILLFSGNYLKNSINFWFDIRFWKIFAMSINYIFTK